MATGKKAKWVDLSPYNMKLQLAILPSKQKLLLIDSVPDEHVAGLSKIGFEKFKEGNAWFLQAPQIPTAAFLKNFPNLIIREHNFDEYVLVVNGENNKNAQKSNIQTKEIDIIENDTYLGYNRYGNKVIENDRGRFFIDARGRLVSENKATNRVDSNTFLRFGEEDKSLVLCIDGFIETILKNSLESEKITVEKFMNTIGFDLSKKDEFIYEINEAALRYVSRRNIKTLNDRYSVAINISNALRELNVSGVSNVDEMVLGRRLMGGDRDLLGKSIFLSSNIQNENFDTLKPKAVRMTETASEANFVLSLLPSKEEALEDLKNRQNGAMSVTFIPVTDIVDAENTLKEISKLGAIEASAFLNSEEGNNSLIVTSVSGELTSDIPKIQEINSKADLWSWASVVVSDRSQSLENMRSGLSGDIDLNAATMAQNSHQVPYKSASKTAEPITMVPKELDEATRTALGRLVTAFDDVDKRVSVECGIHADKLGDYLSPEQIDAVGLAIHAEERGRGFLVADNTGVGKGRTLMSLVKRASLQGRKVLVLTEKAANLSDLMRDLKHINGLEDVKPVVLNENAVLIDESTGKAFEMGDRSKLDEAIKNQVWPDDIPVIIGTYSQFNQSIQDSERSSWLQNVVNEDTLLVLDEIHAAASGTSNTSDNISQAIEKSGPPIFSSATFSSDAKTMSFYERIFPHGMNAEEISAMMRKGGEPFMEIVAAMLVADGVMIRREKDMSTMEISQHIDEDRVQRNRGYMDSLAGVIGEMALLSGELDRVVNDKNNRSDSILKGIQIKRMGFGSPLYRITRLFTAALSAEFAGERAVEALQKGEKPVILVENTIQGILKEAELNGGDAPDFKDVMHRVLDQLTKFSLSDKDGVVDRVDAAEGDRTLQNSLINIRQMIDVLPDLPASAIDVVKQKIKEAGFSCGEITGRVLQVEDGKVVPRKKRDITKTKNAFNAGEIDALIINSAGSTGIDLHSSRRFKNQNKRAMIELQGPANVLKQIQAYGRVSRYDEVVPSRIEVLGSGLPVEIRLAAMKNQKLRRLSANVTSNRDSRYLAQNIPDLINSVGDQVVSRYAEMRPDLIKKLCLSYANEKGVINFQKDSNKEMSDESVVDNTRSANEFMSRLSLLSTDYQEKVLNELTAEYRLHIEELEARGENPLRPKELEGFVHIRESKLFEGSENSALHTVFDGPMHIREVAIERVAESIRSEELMEEIEKGSQASGEIENAINNLTNSLDVYLEPYMPKNIRTVRDAIDFNDPFIITLKKDIEITANALKILSPGREVEMIHGMDAEKTNAIITAIYPPEPAFHHLRSQYMVRLAIPGESKVSSVRLSTLLQDMRVMKIDTNNNVKFMVSDGLTGSDYDKILDKFENASSKKITTAKILSTNIFRAVRLATQYDLGQMISYVDTDGNRHRGVLVKKTFESKLTNLPVRIDGIDQALNALTDKHVGITSSFNGSKRALQISLSGNESWQCYMPAPRNTRFGPRWISDSYKNLFESGRLTSDLDSLVSISGIDELKNVLETLSSDGINTFFVDSKFRHYFIEESDRQANMLEMSA